MKNNFQNDELEIYSLIAGGKTQKQIANIKNISICNVRKNIKSVVDKLNASNKIDALCKLIQLKYI